MSGFRQPLLTHFPCHRDPHRFFRGEDGFLLPKTHKPQPPKERCETSQKASCRSEARKTARSQLSMPLCRPSSLSFAPLPSRLSAITPTEPLVDEEIAMFDPSLIPGLILAGMAFVAGCIVGRTIEADRWRRPVDLRPGEEAEVCHGGRVYRVRCDDILTERPQQDRLQPQIVREGNRPSGSKRQPFPVQPLRSNHEHCRIPSATRRRGRRP